MGYFPMQMNNASGVCAVLCDAIHATGRSAKPGGITEAAHAEAAAVTEGDAERRNRGGPRKRCRLEPL